jgi:hypothetical protein
MGLLAGFFQTVFTSIFGFFATWLGQRGARIALAITFYAAALAALFAAMTAAMAGIVAAVPTTGYGYWILVGISIGLPDNFEICSAAMLSGDVAVFLYRWNMNHVLKAD